MYRKRCEHVWCSKDSYVIYVSQLHQATAEIHRKVTEPISQVPAGDPDVKTCSTVAPGTAVLVGILTKS
jgi:hypothetical protein